VLGSSNPRSKPWAACSRSAGESFRLPGSTRQLFAELDDGNVVEGEAISTSRSTTRPSEIRRVYLEPRVEANPDALNAIETADFVCSRPVTSTPPR